MEEESKMDIAQNQCNEGQGGHHAVGHELFAFGETVGKEYEKKCQYNVSHVRLEDDALDAEYQNGCKAGGSDEGNFALCLEVTNKASDKKEDYVNPENGIRVSMHKIVLRTVA
jgi:hypothetical protein